MDQPDIIYDVEASLAARPREAAPATPERVTPMMAQYIEIKAANADCLLFYRMGDFYELFFHDAEVASKTLGIVLTKRGKHQGEDIPMCGVPVVRADDYLQRLIAAGHRVAVCEQTEDPAAAKARGGKSVVRRDVVRLVTPGTITEEQLLEPGRANLFVALARRKAHDETYLYGWAAVDISTGRFEVGEVSGAALPAVLARLEPREIVLPDAAFDDPSLKSLWRDTRAAMVPVARDGIDPNSAERRLKETFGVASLDAFGSFGRGEVAAAAMAMHYVERTQLGARPPLSPPAKETPGGTLSIDAATRANLELTRTLSGERMGSLLATMDRTVTPGGGRLLAERLAGPLADVDAIAARHDAVALFVDEAGLREQIRKVLARAPDMSRALSRLMLDRGGPRDLSALREGLSGAQDLAALLSRQPDLPAEIAATRDALADVEAGVAERLGACLADELPLLKRDGGFIREGCSPDLDEARNLQGDSRRVIAALQARYAGETGVKTLKVRHNGMIGYFVEVPQAAGETFLQEPFKATFVHRQTMAGAMRFSTVELGELEAKIASAAGRAVALELSIFDECLALVSRHAPAIKQAAEALAVLDVSAALADLAADLDWRRPQVDTSLDLRIEGGRHPVVEAACRRDGKAFVANGVDLSPPPGHRDGRITVITGPNMAGKSTYLRQTALIVVLAQMGAFVPAERATIGLVDRLFSRVGAADDLARGRSTFMVEMIETAAILNQAGRRALVILDEIGRGTATFDGLSIAWACVEQLHAVNRCRALFATHYHELTALSGKLPRLQNATMRVTEWNGDVVFLHEVIAGAADRSYGIQVAKLAGLPSSVVERARQLLTILEKGERERPAPPLIDDLPLFAVAPKREAAPPPPPVRDALRETLHAIDPDDLTPKQALEALYRLKAAVKA